MMKEFQDIVEVEKSPTGKVLREKLRCGHWVETAKRCLQVMNLKTLVPITKRTCKECPPAAKTPAAPRARPAKAAAPVPVSTAAPAGPARRYREPKEAPRVACPGCEGIFVCSSGCSVNKYGTFRTQDLKDAARRLAIKKATEAEVAGPMATPGLEPIQL